MIKIGPSVPISITLIKHKNISSISFELLIIFALKFAAAFIYVTPLLCWKCNLLFYTFCVMQED